MLTLTPREPAAVGVLQAAELDFNASGMTNEEIAQLMSEAKIIGKGSSASCSITSCGSQTVEGHELATGSAAKYLSAKSAIESACADQGLTCSTTLTSTVDGEHLSSCHKLGNEKSGTCGDFVITASECGGSIKLCSSVIQGKYTEIASTVLRNSSDISTCLNEYAISGSSYTTGGHYHCNF
jgi:hypothetical protein